MKTLKAQHKNLMIIEAGFIYSKRYNLDKDTFIDNVFMTDDFDSHEGGEFDNICKDLRRYRHYKSYVPKTITDEEYEMCIGEFGAE